MKSSLKIGAVAGLIAGIVLGIVYEIFNQIVLSLGFFSPFWHPIIINNIVVNIPLFGLWGIVLGIIFSKVYNIIPTRGVLKGLIYGLFLYFIIIFRIEIFDIAYGLILDFVGWNFAGFFSWPSFGLVLGFLYEFLSSRFYSPKKEVKIETYDVRSGILPGAIAGIAGGLASSAFIVPGQIIGYWGVPAASGELVSTIEFWWNQAGSNILINMIEGLAFGAIFTKVYNLIPGKKVLKGLYYGWIMFLISTFLLGTMCVIWPMFHNDWAIATYFAGTFWFSGFFIFTALGLVLGYLYKPPR